VNLQENRVKEEDHALVGGENTLSCATLGSDVNALTGVLGSVLTTAAFYKNANVVNCEWIVKHSYYSTNSCTVILGGAGWGCSLGVLTHYYRAFERESSAMKVKPPTSNPS
jgi:hypothetical protein